MIYIEPKDQTSLKNACKAHIIEYTIEEENITRSVRNPQFNSLKNVSFPSLLSISILIDLYVTFSLNFETPHQYPKLPLPTDINVGSLGTSIGCEIRRVHRNAN